MSFVVKILKKIRERLCLSILKIFGWKTTQTLPKDIDKAVILCAPHTSYWDTFWMIIWGFANLSTKRCFAVFKIEANKSFWGKFYRFLGGIPVDRKKVTEEYKNVSTTELVSQKMKSMNKCLLLISAEGTRKLTKKWKSGFYYIALKANVPILLGKCDYEKKEMGIEKIIYPSGNFEKDMLVINDYYKNVKGKYPDKFSIHLNR